MKMYEVGGCVRDEILGVKSKDIDFSVVLSEEEKSWTWNGGTPWHETLDPYPYMVSQLERDGVKIIRDNDGQPVGAEFLTVRGIHPARGAVDFVLARKESDYTDGRHPDFVEPGTLEDDLARRDFTMNAIAKAADGSYIDPYNGRGDIALRLIRAVGDPMDRLREDALRAVRAMRFQVTKGFLIEESLATAMDSPEIARAVVKNVSDERIQVELSKMLRYNSGHSIKVFQAFERLTDACLIGRVSLDATMKTKGRGK